MPDFLVAILVNKPDVVVKVSSFSARSWPTDFRPVADLDAEGQGPSVGIRVYIEEGEQEKAIQVLKDPDNPSEKKSWVEKESRYKPDLIGNWIGYLEADLPIGDPSIAVGR